MSDGLGDDKSYIFILCSNGNERECQKKYTISAVVENRTKVRLIFIVSQFQLFSISTEATALGHFGNFLSSKTVAGYLVMFRPK